MAGNYNENQGNRSGVSNALLMKTIGEFENEIVALMAGTKRARGRGGKEGAIESLQSSIKSFEEELTRRNAGNFKGNPMDPTRKHLSEMAGSKGGDGYNPNAKFATPKVIPQWEGTVHQGKVTSAEMTAGDPAQALESMMFKQAQQQQLLERNEANTTSDPEMMAIIIATRQEAMQMRGDQILILQAIMESLETGIPIRKLPPGAEIRPQGSGVMPDQSSF